jgi:hypothetical protein
VNSKDIRVYILENVMRAGERMTGFATHGRRRLQEALRERKPRARIFNADGTIPNNPALPFVIYRGAVAVRGASDPAALFEILFEANGWGDSCRNGILERARKTIPEVRLPKKDPLYGHSGPLIRLRHARRAA